MGPTNETQKRNTVNACFEYSYVLNCSFLHYDLAVGSKVTFVEIQRFNRVCETPSQVYEFRQFRPSSFYETFDRVIYHGAYS